MLTLSQFLQDNRLGAFISYPGLRQLYLNKAEVRCTAGVFDKALTIEKVYAYVIGDGSFSRLVKDLRERGFVVFVKGVDSQAFVDRLFSMGFGRIDKYTFVLGVSLPKLSS